MNYLVTAIGSISAEAVISRLALIPNATVIGCNVYPASWTPASRLVDRFYQVPIAHDEAAYIARLLEICKNEQISHVIALTDPEVDILSSNSEMFSTAGIVLCISPKHAVHIARDKLSVYQYFSGHPRIHPIPTADLQELEPIKLPWPLIAKPRRGRSSEEQVRITDTTALHHYRRQFSERDYIIQHFHSGDVVVVDVVRQPHIPAAAMARLELLRTANGAGQAVHMQPEHPCATLAIEVAEILDLRGCINIEFLMVDGIPLLMDVNPRFSAGVIFSIMAGYDMVTNHLRCFNTEKIAPCPPSPDVIYTRGYIEYSLQD